MDDKKEERTGQERVMDWTIAGFFIALLSVIVAMWWRLDSKIETRIGRLEKLLTDNLIVLNRVYSTALLK